MGNYPPDVPGEQYFYPSEPGQILLDYLAGGESEHLHCSVFFFQHGSEEDLLWMKLDFLRRVLVYFGHDPNSLNADTTGPTTSLSLEANDGAIFRFSTHSGRGSYYALNVDVYRFDF